MDALLRLLARREHSAQELVEKMIKKGYPLAEISHKLTELQNANLQSDERFAESYFNSRVNRGYGPNFIKQALLHKGIDEWVIETLWKRLSVDWEAIAYDVWRKKFKSHTPNDAKEMFKQKRFLYYRGFDGDTISKVLANEYSNSYDS